MQEGLVIRFRGVRNLVLMGLPGVDRRERAIIRPNEALKILEVAASCVVVRLFVLLGGEDVDVDRSTCCPWRGLSRNLVLVVTVSVQKGLFKWRIGTVCIHLSLLDCALLLVQLLVGQLLHLVAIGLVHERFDGVQLGGTAGRDSHVRHFWRRTVQNRCW